MIYTLSGAIYCIIDYNVPEKVEYDSKNQNINLIRYTFEPWISATS